jgi:hypothetical protein
MGRLSPDGDRNAGLSNANESFADHRVTGDPPCFCLLGFITDQVLLMGRVSPSPPAAAQATAPQAVRGTVRLRADRSDSDWRRRWMGFMPSSCTLLHAAAATELAGATRIGGVDGWDRSPGSRGRSGGSLSGPRRALRGGLRRLRRRGRLRCSYGPVGAALRCWK